MKLQRVDWTSVLAICVGTTVGVAATATLVQQPQHTDVHVTRTLVEAAGVDGPTVEAEARPATQGKLMLRRSGVGSNPNQPIVFIDGVRVVNISVLEHIGPERIDRIEVIKGEAALSFEGLSDGEGAHGIVQVFLKGERSGSGGS